MTISLEDVQEVYNVEPENETNRTTPFEEGLCQWMNDRRSTGNKAEAIQRIKDAYYNNKERLDLSWLNLSSLPPEICSLSSLIYLDLSNNRLEQFPNEILSFSNLAALSLSDNKLDTIPSEISSLSSLECLILKKNCFQHFPTELYCLNALTWLFLDHNHLQTLPPDISRFASLQRLILSNNNIRTLPSETGNWNTLKTLDLRKNQLRTLPSEIGRLTSLSVLLLDHNLIEYIPSQVGNLRNLGRLTITNNPALHELPLTIGNLPQLTDFSCEGTQVPQEIVSAILSSCRTHRDSTALHDLPRRIILWQRYSKENYHLEFTKGNFSENHMILINEWLIRLERAREFHRNQASLATLVCKILSALETHTDFRERFFSHIRENLSNCGDRAAMSFNETYTDWLLHTMTTEGDFKEKLKLLTGLAKTLALRIALSKCIEQREALLKAERGKKVILKESVEIYLCYEKRLKERLGLVTAIETMAYESIGARPWISEELLVHEVDERYMDILIDLPVALELFKHAETTPSEHMEDMQNRLESLELQLEKGELSEQEYLSQTAALRDELEKIEREVRRNWILAHVE